MGDYIESGTTHLLATLKRKSETILTVASLGGSAAAFKQVATSRAGSIISTAMKKKSVKKAARELGLSVAATAVGIGTSQSHQSKLKKDAEELGLFATEAKNSLTKALDAMDEFEKFYHGMLEKLQKQSGGANRRPIIVDSSTKNDLNKKRNKIRDKLELSAEKFQSCLNLLDKIIKNLSKEQIEFKQYKRDLDYFWNKLSTLDKTLTYFR